MELLFLGTGAADWPQNQPVEATDIRRMTSTLLDDSTLIDCGPDAYGYYCYLGKDPSKITDVILSHSHGDHINFGELKKFAEASGHIRFWCDVVAKAKVDAQNIDGVEAIAVTPYEEVEINGYKVMPLVANHFEGETDEKPLHYIIEKDGKKLFYGCDGAMFLGRTWLILRSAKLDCVILDCTSGDFIDHLRFGTHNSIPMVKLIVQAMRERKVLGENSKVVASHLARTLHTSHAETAELLAKDNIITAYDGMTLTV